jgi:tRNA threonylcarbamoyladenosine biosynthesis protein TsaB
VTAPGGTDRRRVAVAFETSTRAPTVAALVGGAVLESSLAPERAHASDLLPELGRLLERSGAGIREVDLVAVGVGPGSFTGLRVGIATALGIVRATGARLFALPSTEVLAWSELPAGASGVVLADARRGELYLARYRREKGAIAVEVAPGVAPPSEIAARAAAGDSWLCEDEVARDAALAAGADSERVRIAAPRARALLELALARVDRDGPTDPTKVEPLYLRPFASPPPGR